MSLKESKVGGLEGLEWRKRSREDDANYNFQNKEKNIKSELVITIKIHGILKKTLGKL